MEEKKERITICPVCLSPMEEISQEDFYREIKDRGAVFSSEFCTRCRTIIDEGNVILIEVKDGESQEKHPNRTGKFVAIKREALSARTKGGTNLLKKDVLFIEESMLQSLLGVEYANEQKEPE
jgi:hypothetical protein